MDNQPDLPQQAQPAPPSQPAADAAQPGQGINSAPAQAAPIATPKASGKLILWGWILVALIPAAIVMFTLLSFARATMGMADNNAVTAAINSLVFLAGTLGVFGFPAGIVMLVIGYSRRHSAAVNR